VSGRGGGGSVTHECLLLVIRGYWRLGVVCSECKVWQNLCFTPLVSFWQVVGAVVPPQLTITDQTAEHASCMSAHILCVSAQTSFTDVLLL
jgi:hypothetical protein